MCKYNENEIMHIGTPFCQKISTNYTHLIVWHTNYPCRKLWSQSGNFKISGTLWLWNMSDSGTFSPNSQLRIKCSSINIMWVTLHIVIKKLLIRKCFTKCRCMYATHMQHIYKNRTIPTSFPLSKEIKR